MGEVGQLEDSVDERQADRAERINRAEREAVQGSLRDVVQAVPRDQDQHAENDHCGRGVLWIARGQPYGRRFAQPLAERQVDGA